MDPRITYLQALRGLALLGFVRSCDPPVLEIDTPRLGEPPEARPCIIAAIAAYMTPDGFRVLEPYVQRRPTPETQAQVAAALINYEAFRRAEGAGRELWQVVAEHLGVDWRTVPGALPGSEPGRLPGVSYH